MPHNPIAPIALPACASSWTNDTPGIGLAATGSGTTIPGFTAINTGTTPTFTATPTNPGATSTYRWLLNSASVGTSTTTFNTSALNNTDRSNAS